MKGGRGSSGDFISFWYSCADPADKHAGYQKDIKSLLCEGRWGGLAGGFWLGCLKQRFCFAKI